MVSTWFEEFLQNRLLFTSILAWFTAETIKVPIRRFYYKEQNWRKLWGAGGMPSAHSATVFSMAVSLGLRYGFGSSIFALASTLAMVVMYDACGVRRQVGIQAKLLNAGRGENEEMLKESVGHSPLQVFSGAAWGGLVALLAYLFV